MRNFKTLATGFCHQRISGDENANFIREGIEAQRDTEDVA
jgi:hypothetical protein